MSQKAQPRPPPGPRNVVQYTADQADQTKTSTRRKTIGPGTARKTKSNPVQIAFQQELNRFVGYVDRQQKPTIVDKIEEEISDSPARSSNTLFELWNRYCTKLPRAYFASKLISTGDYLFKAKVKCLHYYFN